MSNQGAMVLTSTEESVRDNESSALNLIPEGHGGPLLKQA